MPKLAEKGPENLENAFHNVSQVVESKENEVYSSETLKVSYEEDENNGF